MHSTIKTAVHAEHALEKAGYNVCSTAQSPRFARESSWSPSGRTARAWPAPVDSVTVAKLDPPTGSDKSGRAGRGKERCKAAYAKVFADGVPAHDVDCWPGSTSPGRFRGAQGGPWVSTRGPAAGLPGEGGSVGGARSGRCLGTPSSGPSHWRSGGGGLRGRPDIAAPRLQVRVAGWLGLAASASG